MHKWHMFICIGAVIFLVGYTVYQGNNTAKTVVDEQPTLTERSNDQIETEVYHEQTDDTGPVTVTIKPLRLAQSDNWEFEVTLQTHSVDLDMDLLESVVMIDRGGNESSPISWNGDPPGGHHRTGTVSFVAPDSVPSSITIYVKNVADVPIREFNWGL